MNIYEVFLKKAGKEEFRHAGSMEAPDDDMALMLARESYSRRGEGDEMWVVDRGHLLVADSHELRTNAVKPHRHNDGKAVADHRKSSRSEPASEATT